MGGINCPPPPRDGLTPGLEESYINNLAQYCSSLFGGTSMFFSANAVIEQAVIHDQDSCIDSAIALLTSGEHELIQAQSFLGTVSSMWAEIAGDEPPVDFVTQLTSLADAAAKVKTARMDLMVLPDGMAIQRALWAEPGLSDNFAEASRAINGVIAWQLEFSLSSKRALARA